MEAVSLVACLSDIPDPRTQNANLRHRLVDVLVIGFCGVICGCETFTDMEHFGHCKREFFESLLGLEHGIPSHDTFGRVFAAVPPETLMAVLSEWMRLRAAPDSKPPEPESPESEAASPAGQPGVHVDGKAMRRTGRGQALVHLVGAWASEQGLALGQRAVDHKSNEIEAIPHLLEILDLEGTVVTIDAAGTQKSIAKVIREKKADYVLALKKNHPKLHDAVVDRFLEATEAGHSDVQHVREQERSHGRDERRDYYQLPVPEDLPQRGQWPGLRSLGMVVRTWIDQASGQERSAMRYYLSSLPAGENSTDGQNDGAVRELAKHVRGHWGVENSLHWVLDVAFREDECTTENPAAAANLSAMNRIALSALKSDTKIKRSVKGKRKNAGWDNAYLNHILRIAADT